MIIAIVGRRSIKYIWLTNDLDMLLPYVCLEVVGILAVLVWQTTPLMTPLLVVPAITTYIAFEMIHRLQRQTQEAMIAMADAIDQRDPYTADHSRRVAELAVRIAEKRASTSATSSGCASRRACMTSARSASATTCCTSQAS